MINLIDNSEIVDFNAKEPKGDIKWFGFGFENVELIYFKLKVARGSLLVSGIQGNLAIADQGTYISEDLSAKEVYMRFILAEALDPSNQNVSHMHQSELTTVEQLEAHLSLLEYHLFTPNTSDVTDINFVYENGYRKEIYIPWKGPTFGPNYNVHIEQPKSGDYSTFIIKEEQGKWGTNE